MPPVEIDETQLASFQTMRDFVVRGLSNPKTRKLLKEAERQLYPDQAIPELDARDEVMAAVDERMKALDERIAGFDKAREEREERDRLSAVQRQWNEGQSKAKAAGYTAEGLEQLEKFMQEKGVFDHEIAIPAFERIHPPAEPATTGNGSSWNFFDIPKDQPDMQSLLEGRDEEYLNQMIPTALRDVRGS